jgi:hypothetical protein
LAGGKGRLILDLPPEFVQAELDFGQRHWHAAAGQRRWRSRSAVEPRGGGVRAALGAPLVLFGPEPPDKPPTSPVSARACRRTGARGLSPRELHLLGVVFRG